MREDQAENNEELTEEQRFNSWIKLSLMFTAASGGGEFDWDDLQDEHQEGLRHAYRECQKCVAEADGTSYDTIARKVYEAFARCVSPHDVPEWKNVAAIEKSCWNHLTRHMANLLQIEPDRDGGPEQHEEEMLARFVRSIQPPQGTPA